MAMSIANGTRVTDDGDGGAVYMFPYNEQLAKQSALSGVSARTDPEPDASTADPVTGDEEEGGVVKRANEFMSSVGPVALEAIGLQGMEIAKANAKRAGELYRNKFPLLHPRYTRKCAECGAEFDEEVDVCEFCDGTDLQEPSPKQRTRAERFFQEVNREGQSLRQLYKYLARDGGRLGVWLHVVTKTYTYWDKPTLTIGNEAIIEHGEVYEQARELVRGDPKRIKPVVDENGRIGNWWWACPVCEDRVNSMKRQPGRCDEHGVERREVHYAEVENVGATEPEKVFFADEVVDYAPFEPRLGGRDGFSPVDPLWLKQAILQWMDLYAGSYFDTKGSNRYPGKLLIVHTTNKEGFEKSLDQAQDEADEDAYAQGIIYNEVAPGVDADVDQAQVIDMMSDTILGQSDQLKQDYKSDIRSRYGLVDVQDSELEDAGGLNNEGLQMAINDRDKATTHQDLMEGPLRKLMETLGFDDWEIRFVPPEQLDEEPSTLETVRGTALAEQHGLAYSIEDGRLEIQDTDGVVDPEPAPDDGSSGPPGDDGSPTDVQPPDVDPGPAPNQQGGDDLDTALRQLEAMQRSIVWAEDDSLDVEQQARQPLWNDAGDMPKFVKQLIEQALNSGAIYRGEYDARNVTGGAVKRYFDEKLDQPAGWSRRSLIEDFADRFQISKKKAADTLETQLTNVLNEARAEGYEEQGDTDERYFAWTGPSDGSTTPECKWLKEQTNPRYGGTPVTLEELQELVKQARNGDVTGLDGYPEFEGADWSVHYSERHSFVEKFPPFN